MLLTIQELANLAGVSISTVSRIMNHKDENISDVTREKVLKIAKKHNYTPYSKAIQKALQKTKLIGVLVTDLSNPFYAIIVKLLDDELSQQDYGLIVISTNAEQTKEKESIDLLLSKHVECIVSLYEHKKITALNKLQDDTAFINFPLESFGEKNSFFNMQQAMDDAVIHLLSYSIDKIAFFLHNNSLSKLFKQSITSNNKPYDKSLVFKISDHEEDLAKFMKLLSKSDTKAIIVENADIARLIYKYAFESKLTIPEDISIISFDFKNSSKEFVPELCTLSPSHENIANTIANSIIDEINGVHNNKNENNNLTLIKGRSVFDNNFNKKRTISVIGSINIDVNLYVDNICGVDETMIVHDRTTLSGGKAANQAIGVSRLNGKSTIISVLGNDREGKELYNNLMENGVDVKGLNFENSIATGTVYMFLTPDGKTLIGDYIRTSSYISKEYVDKHVDIIKASQFCLAQTGMPLNTIKQISKICRENKVNLILKPSVTIEMTKDILDGLFVILPNLTELFQIVREGFTLEEKASLLIDKGVQNVIVTTGKDGCYYTNGSFSKYYPAMDFDSIDSIGASDSFISALAVFLSEDMDMDTAINNANIAAGISTTRLGAQTSLPDRETFDIYKKRLLLY